MLLPVTGSTLESTQARAVFQFLLAQDMQIICVQITMAEGILFTVESKEEMNCVYNHSALYSYPSIHHSSKQIRTYPT